MAIAELPVRTKTCRACGETKPVSEFHKDRTRGDGYKARCATCSSKGNRERRVEDAHVRLADDRKIVARVAAIKRLVAMHDRDFQKLLADEYLKAGIDKVWRPYMGDSSVGDG